MAPSKRKQPEDGNAPAFEALVDRVKDVEGQAATLDEGVGALNVGIGALNVGVDELKNNVSTVLLSMAKAQDKDSADRAADRARLEAKIADLERALAASEASRVSSLAGVEAKLQALGDSFSKSRAMKEAAYKNGFRNSWFALVSHARQLNDEQSTLLLDAIVTLAGDRVALLKTIGLDNHKSSSLGGSESRAQTPCSEREDLRRICQRLLLASVSSRFAASFPRSFSRRGSSRARRAPPSARSRARRRLRPRAERRGCRQLAPARARATERLLRRLGAVRARVSSRGSLLVCVVIVPLLVCG